MTVTRAWSGDAADPPNRATVAATGTRSMVWASVSLNRHGRLSAPPMFDRVGLSA
ncbi:MAG: hypothetical protein M0007_13490 [Actinomycetota bacterium]|nr:hypothetical protein [Actinomycetota bacterium]